jgi:hypothetical protein
MVVLQEGSPISTEELWSSVRVTKALLSRFLSLAGQPALGRLLVVTNVFHLRIMEATVFLRTCFRYCLVPFPRSVPQHNPVSELYGQFLQLHGLVFALSNVGPYIDRCVSFQITSNQLNLPQVDSNQVVEHQG